MRLSQWRGTAPAKEAVTPKIAAVVDPVPAALGAGPDPHCWVAWGEEPANRFTTFVATDPGLIVCHVRVNVPGEGPRASTKLVRWSRVSIGELGVETQAGHRMLSFQLESQVLRGVDDEADRAAAFARQVIAAIDGRPIPAIPETKVAGRRAGSGSKVAKAPKPSGAAVAGSRRTGSTGASPTAPVKRLGAGASSSAGRR